MNNKLTKIQQLFENLSPGSKYIDFIVVCVHPVLMHILLANLNLSCFNNNINLKHKLGSITSIFKLLVGFHGSSFLSQSCLGCVWDMGKSAQLLFALQPLCKVLLPS